MLSSRVREIPIVRESGQRHSYPASGRTASPANCPPAREIPIQRDTGVGSRPLSDFFDRQDRVRGWGGPWPNNRSSFNSDMFDSEPFSHHSGFHSRAGFPSFPSHLGNDFWGDRRSPLQKPFSRQHNDHSSPHHVESPITTSPPPQQPAEAETMPILPPKLPENHVPIFIEPAADVEPSANETEPSANQTESSTNQTETTSDASDGSLRVEEPQQRGRSPSPVPPNMTPLEIIEQVLDEGARLKEEVDVYCGGRKEKQYLRLEELLTRLMLKLDRIESEGRDDIRKARREAVHTIQSTLELLESRTSGNPPPAKSDAVPENSSSESMIESASETDMETCRNDVPKSRDSDQTKDAAAVKEMVLSSEVPC